VYQWLGPYVQFSLDKGFFARFTAGADIELHALRLAIVLVDLVAQHGDGDTQGPDCDE